MATAKMTDKEKAKNRAKVLKGIPYTKEGLEALKVTNLAIVLGHFKINPFKLKDASIAGKIQAILTTQAGGEVVYKKPDKKKK